MKESTLILLLARDVKANANSRLLYTDAPREIKTIILSTEVFTRKYGNFRQTLFVRTKLPSELVDF